MVGDYFVVPHEAPKWVAYIGGGLMFIVFLSIPPALMRRHAHGGEDTLGNIGVGTLAVLMAVGGAIAIVGADALFGAGLFGMQS